MMRSTTAVLVTALLALGAPLQADEVVLKDGSRLQGEVQELSGGKLQFKPTFTEVLELDPATIQTLDTDKVMVVQTPDGQLHIGPLAPAPQQPGVVIEGSQSAFQLTDVSAIWVNGAESPEERALREAIEKAKAAWSLRLEAGIDGSTGNTERVGANARITAKRETPDDRFEMYLFGRYAKTDGVTNEHEVIGGAKLEVDFSERAFAYIKGELETDRFENLTLRTTVTAGVGYFFIQEEDQELKGHVGVGYQHESFRTGGSDDRVIGELGIDYWLEVTPWLRYTHSTIYYPSLEDFPEDFRLTMSNAAEIPLTNDKDWKLRLGVRHQYDSMPTPGIERLDTFYFANIVVDWK